MHSVPLFPVVCVSGIINLRNSSSAFFCRRSNCEPRERRWASATAAATTCDEFAHRPSSVDVFSALMLLMTGHRCILVLECIRHLKSDSKARQGLGFSSQGLGFSSRIPPHKNAPRNHGFIKKKKVFRPPKSDSKGRQDLGLSSQGLGFSSQGLGLGFRV